MSGQQQQKRDYHAAAAETVAAREYWSERLPSSGPSVPGLPWDMLQSLPYSPSTEVQLRESIPDEFVTEPIDAMIHHDHDQEHEYPDLEDAKEQREYYEEDPEVEMEVATLARMLGVRKMSTQLLALNLLNAADEYTSWSDETGIAPPASTYTPNPSWRQLQRDKSLRKGRIGFLQAKIKEANEGQQMPSFYQKWAERARRKGPDQIHVMQSALRNRICTAYRDFHDFQLLSTREWLLKVSRILFNTNYQPNAPLNASLLSQFTSKILHDPALAVLESMRESQVVISDRCIVAILNFYIKNNDRKAFSRILSPESELFTAKVKNPWVWVGSRTRGIAAPPAPGNPKLFAVLMKAAFKFNWTGSAESWLSLMHQYRVKPPPSVIIEMLRDAATKKDWEKGLRAMRTWWVECSDKPLAKPAYAEFAYYWMLHLCRVCGRVQIYRNLLNAAVTGRLRWTSAREHVVISWTTMQVLDDWRRADYLASFYTLREVGHCIDYVHQAICESLATVSSFIAVKIREGERFMNFCADETRQCMMRITYHIENKVLDYEKILDDISSEFALVQLTQLEARSELLRSSIGKVARKAEEPVLKRSAIRQTRKYRRRVVHRVVTRPASLRGQASRGAAQAGPQEETDRPSKGPFQIQYYLYCASAARE